MSKAANILITSDFIENLDHTFYTVKSFYVFCVSFVAAGCLYLACRNEQIPLLLLDFSDQLEETVVDLSQMYIRIARELCINPPSADPCIYIERFCEK